MSLPFLYGHYDDRERLTTPINLRLAYLTLFSIRSAG